MLAILYYPDGSRGPVRDYLDDLAGERPKSLARIALDLEILGAKGTPFPADYNQAAWRQVMGIKAPRLRKMIWNLREED